MHRRGKSFANFEMIDNQEMYLEVEASSCGCKIPRGMGGVINRFFFNGISSLVV